MILDRDLFLKDVNYGLYILGVISKIVRFEAIFIMY